MKKARFVSTAHTGGMAELNVVGGTRGEVVSVEHEGADAVVQLGWDVVVLVGSESAWRAEGVSVVGTGRHNLVVGLCA